MSDLEAALTAAQARIAALEGEREAGEAEYERILGDRTFREVADALAAAERERASAREELRVLQEHRPWKPTEEELRAQLNEARAALRRIAGWRPATTELDLATTMADEADRALSRSIGCPGD